MYGRLNPCSSLLLLLFSIHRPSSRLFLRAVFHLNLFILNLVFFPSRFLGLPIFSLFCWNKKKTSKNHFFKKRFLDSRIVEVVGLLRQSLFNCHFVIGWKSSYRRGKNILLAFVLDLVYLLRRWPHFHLLFSSWPFPVLSPVSHVSPTKENTRTFGPFPVASCVCGVCVYIRMI